MVLLYGCIEHTLELEISRRPFFRSTFSHSNGFSVDLTPKYSLQFRSQTVISDSPKFQPAGRRYDSSRLECLSTGNSTAYAVMMPKTIVPISSLNRVLWRQLSFWQVSSFPSQRSPSTRDWFRLFFSGTVSTSLLPL